VTTPEAPSAQFSVRPASEDDLAAIMKVETTVHKVPWSEENFRAELSKPYSSFLLMTDDETDSTIAAYLVSWTMFDETHVLNVAVDLPYRGLGFAKALVRKVVDEGQRKGIRKVLLEVRKSNLPAIHLYQSLKFVIVHVRKNFYSDGEDAYQMALYLNETGAAIDTDHQDF
jgi:[ribosomal protein S18]-alanine N-acetyltransferase